MATAKTTKKAADTTEAVEVKKPATKKACAKKTTTKKTTLALNTENVGFKAGDVYQALAAAGQALSVEEIAKAAKISNEETLLGIGWLFKEGKIVASEEKIALA